MAGASLLVGRADGVTLRRGGAGWRQRSLPLAGPVGVGRPHISGPVEVGRPHISGPVEVGRPHTASCSWLAPSRSLLRSARCSQAVTGHIVVVLLYVVVVNITQHTAQLNSRLEGRRAKSEVALTCFIKKLRCDADAAREQGPQRT